MRDPALECLRVRNTKPRKGTETRVGDLDEVGVSRVRNTKPRKGTETSFGQGLDVIFVALVRNTKPRKGTETASSSCLIIW